MILLWGLPEEGPMAAVSEALAGLGAKTVFADQRRLLDIEVDLDVVHGEPQGRLRTAAGETDLTAIGAVYLRGYDWRVLPELCRFAPGGAEWRHAAEVEDRLGAFVELSETLITTDRAALLEFWERHGRVVYKSISGVRSIVARLSAAHRVRLRHLASCPTQFQTYVPGVHVRVHIVGGEVYACRIVSEADDYRYAARHGHGVEITPFDLPLEWTERCLALARSMDLAVAGIDLRVTPEGLVLLRGQPLARLYLLPVRDRTTDRGGHRAPPGGGQRAPRPAGPRRYGVCGVRGRSCFDAFLLHLPQWRARAVLP